MAFTPLEIGLFDTIGGLPVHPLVVHAAVVLIPLAAIGTLAVAFAPTLRARYGSLVVVLFGIAAAAGFVAKESGEALADRIGEPETHAFWGDILPAVAAAAFVLTLAWYLVQRRADKADKSSVVSQVLAVVASVGSIGAIVLTVLAGHSGAQEAWGDALDPSPAPTAAVTTTAPAPTTPAETPSAAATPTPASGTYTLAQVATHNSPQSCWAAIRGTVYDLTDWISRHPGGAQRIRAICGTDATADFTAKHAGQTEPASRLAQFEIGRLA